MPLAIVLVVALVVLSIGGIVLWARLAATNVRKIETPAGEAEARFHGGVMCRHVVTSGSLAKLEFFDWGVRLCGVVISRWLVPTWEARYDELAIAELVALPMSRIGVWFQLRGERSGIAFLSERNPEILRVLEKRGVPVNRSVTRISKVEDLYK